MSEKERDRMTVMATESKMLESAADFPIDLIMKEGAFTVGARGCGKSNMLKLLVARALSEKIQVKVIDPSLVWKDFPLPFVRVRGDSVRSEWNAVYDLSRLSVLEARDFVSKMIARDLQEAILLTDLGKKPQCLIVLEECQNIVPSNSLRAMRFQDISRFVTQSRNFGLSYLASTQRLSSVDINLIEISGVRFWHKLEGHRNLSKARWWLGKFHTWNLRNLEVGSCYMQNGSNVKLLALPLFSTEKVIA